MRFLELDEPLIGKNKNDLHRFVAPVPEEKMAAARHDELEDESDDPKEGEMDDGVAAIGSHNRQNLLIVVEEKVADGALIASKHSLEPGDVLCVRHCKNTRVAVALYNRRRL